MNGLEELLREVLASHGWEVPERTPDYRVRDFVLIAENDVAIVFAATSSAEKLISDSKRLGAQIALVMKEASGDKTWEGYLLLFVPLLSPEHREAIASVQRDLTFCRRMVVETSTIVASQNPRRSLESRLSFLFPLSLAETTVTLDPETLLRHKLIEHGHSEHVIDALLRGIDDAHFDPIAFLSAQMEPAG